MKNTIILLPVLVSFFASPTSSAGQDENLKQTLTAFYKQVDRLFSSCSKGYLERTSLTTSLEIDIIPEGFEPPKYVIIGDLSVQARGKDLQFQSAYNYYLSKSLDNSESDKKMQSVLTEEAATLQAQGYLTKFSISLPKDVTLTTASFDKNYSSCWEVRWTRKIGTYPWDNFNLAELESIYVVFHESLGLIAIGNNIFTPPPKNLAVAITSKQAIEKAIKCVPLVMRTSFYRQARVTGFTVGEMQSCTLKIAVPNWLLDPKRAIWIRNKTPEETRLCWVVRFSTIKPVTHQEKTDIISFSPPDILIYIDAGSGEVVGANFT